MRHTKCGLTTIGAQKLPGKYLYGLACVILVAVSSVPIPAVDTLVRSSRYEHLFRAMDPTITVEIHEAKMNAVIDAHPGDLDIPDAYEDPQVDFGPGNIEVSARRKFLFIVSRVRVSMVPTIRRGRLRLVVSKVHAGRIRIPSAFHRGVAEMIEAPINQWLEDNDVSVQQIEITEDTIRAKARIAQERQSAEPVASRVQ